jgi:hypothetical protein
MNFRFRYLWWLLALPMLMGLDQRWNPNPWLADLAQIRASIDRDYPNRDWLESERGVSLDRWFDRAEDAIRRGGSDTEARIALDTLIKRFNDGHLNLRWPKSSENSGYSQELAPSAPTTVSAFCAARGFDAQQVSAGTAASLPNYQEVAGEVFQTGVVRIGNQSVGILRIGVFSVEGYPALCEKAVATKKIAIDQPCDDRCEDEIQTESYALLTRELIAAVGRLQAKRVQTMVIDITGNGGGTDWVETAARIVSPLSLKSAPVWVMRNQYWVDRWRTLGSKLAEDVANVPQVERAQLAQLAAQANAIAADLEPCVQPSCPRLTQAGFASGLLAQAQPNQFTDKTWGVEVFNPSQFPYRESVWRGALIVLVDSQSWSAAEQFAAVLRDNNAAIVMGERTGGAGCGHIDRNEPIVLSYNKAELEMPNCARFRLDGSNEVGGIVPDINTGVRWNDGAKFAGRLTQKRLVEAVAAAKAQRR